MLDNRPLNFDPGINIESFRSTNYYLSTDAMDTVVKIEINLPRAVVAGGFSNCALLAGSDPDHGRGRIGRGARGRNYL
jgi:hypothetical protein